MSYTLLFKTKNDLQSVISDIKPELIQFNTELTRIAYSPDTLLDEGQCYKIEEFSKQEFYPDFLSKEFATGQYSQWNSDDQEIEFILYTDRAEFYFQRFVKSQLIEKYWFSISREPKLKNENIITFNEYASACYIKNDDLLLFKKLDDLKRIFRGIENLYREATKDEIEKFLDNDLLDTRGYNRDKIGLLNSKRIALAKGKIDKIEDKKNFCSTLKNYCKEIEISNGDTIVIKTEGDLKNFLYALDERFYTTERSKEKRLANSVIKK